MATTAATPRQLLTNQWNPLTSKQITIPSHTSKYNRAKTNEAKQHLMSALRATHIAAMTTAATTPMQLLTNA
eukprot:14123933-Ditylum_brightwellii.AAC.1